MTSPSESSTTAFMFPGQGSQAVGMGKALCEQYEEARRVFEQADDALGFHLSTLCFEGPEADLQLTANTQPAILACSIAALRVLEAHTPLRPRVALGHSLGELSALVAVGALDFGDAIRLVRLRGQAMQDSVPAGVGSMAAILGLEAEDVEALCAKVSTDDEQVSPANLNGGRQVVVAGHVAAVDRMMDAAHEAEARVIPLKVSAPFHCALMQPAAERLAAALASTPIGALSAPVITNVEAEPNSDRDRVAALLVAQVTNKVRWEESVRMVVRMGITQAVEVGHGKVLKGLVRRIARELPVHSFGEPADVSELV
ncbi:ACP S-malonyltransferase [Nannocystaceae bacterium ST9]